MDEKIFSIGYTGARQMVKKAGRKIGIELNPHDLRRHAATYASRAGASIEIVSKVILRHANLSTTQRYLGKVSERCPHQLGLMRASFYIAKNLFRTKMQMMFTGV